MVTVPLSSLADHADERFAEAQRSRLAKVEAAPESPEGWEQRVVRKGGTCECGHKVWEHSPLLGGCLAEDEQGTEGDDVRYVDDCHEFRPRGTSR